MKIAILYICTGKYSVFWNEFYETCEAHFLKGLERKYFVFTDSDQISSSENISVLYRAAEGFPIDSLMRFNMFDEIKDRLKEFDYIFFFNANMKFLGDVGPEILPSNEQSGLVAVLHPGYYKKSKFWFPLEKNRRSSAYVSYSNAEKYFMGSLNGGIAAEYLELVASCKRNIEIDLKAGIIAVYHDESHLNKYLNGRDILQLDPMYAFPENSDLPFQARILIRNKMRIGGAYFDKLPKGAFIRRVKRSARFFVESIAWKLLS